MTHSKPGTGKEILRLREGLQEVQVVQDRGLFPERPRRGNGRHIRAGFGKLRELLRHIGTDLRRSERCSHGKCPDLQFDVRADVSER